MRYLPLAMTLALSLSACDDDTQTQPEDTPPDSAEDVEIDGTTMDTEEDTAEVDTGPPPEPPKLALTINAIPTTMNGSQPFTSDTITEPTAYRYTVPRSGFTFDLLASAATELDLETLTFSCDLASGEGDSRVEAGAPITAEWTPRGSRAWRWRVAPELAFDVGTATCTAEVSDTHGQSSGVLTYTVDVAEMTPERDPFAETDVWLFVTSRDSWTVSAPTNNNDGTLAIDITYGPNGVPDFEEDLRAIGLVSDAAGPSAYARRLLEDRLIELSRSWFFLEPDGSMNDESVNIAFHFEGHPGAPTSTDPGVSLMALGGSDGRQPGNPINGRARIDWNNQKSDDNTADDLGVFTSSMFAAVVSFEIGVNALSEILPGVGQPIGTHPSDATIWTDTFDRSASTDTVANARYDAVVRIIDLGGLALASVLVHEMGHSLGLVPYGLPPNGLFAEVGLADFMASQATDAHIDTQGLNIMQQGNALANDIAPLLLGSQPSFSAPNLAYLQRRIIVYAE